MIHRNGAHVVKYIYIMSDDTVRKSYLFSFFKRNFWRWFRDSLFAQDVSVKYHGLKSIGLCTETKSFLSL